jgi:23S rRNA-/tRNA-specific pseudouridylate synthase
MTSCWVLQQFPFRQARLSLMIRQLRQETASIRPRHLLPAAASSNSGLFSSSTTLTSSSDTSFFTHALIKEDGVTVPQAIAQSVGNLVQKECDKNSIVVPKRDQRLTPHQLLLLGSIWYMPVHEVEHNNKRSPDKPHSLIYKPQRLTLANRTLALQVGDYLRIHHTPRRFTRVYDQYWSSRHRSNSTDQHQIIVDNGDGFWIIDKPPLVPVHATVDNCLENVVQQLRVHNTDKDYVTTTQRIDINTSGLMVVATKPAFAAYFAQLLRRKTKSIKKRPEDAASKATDLSWTDATNIQKEYRCLVCIQEIPNQDRPSSIVDSWQELKDLEDNIVRHYLESSDRAPKRFERSPPSMEDQSSSKWLECLLKVRQVSPLIPIPTPDSPLAQALWAQQTTTSIPPNTKAVCEVDIQLLTGRTHQIRGQLSKLGFPIVGDEHYGGAIPRDEKMEQNVQLLALQCCQIGFWDANYEQVWNRKRRKDIIQGSPSDRWVSAVLHAAWWTPHLKVSRATDNETTSNEDLELLLKQKHHQNSNQSSLAETQEEKGARVDLLPPTVQLSPGENKYVLMKAVSENETVYWFVKSASPEECGGPYHANVAQDVIEWIEAAGFSNVQVTGGGRIDYDPDRKTAHVYGFSYGFGKGDHAQAAELIESFSSQLDGGDDFIKATYDNSNSLY